MLNGSKIGMILVFDIGNSNITIGAYDKDELAFTARLITDSELDAESYADKIQGILFYPVRPVKRLFP